MALTAQLALLNEQRVFANSKRINLLKQIAVTGSLNQGAKAAGMSYKAAWDAISEMNTSFEEAVVISEKGGKGGGGAKLTPFAQRLLKVFAITEQVQTMALNALWDNDVNMNSLLELMAHFSLRTSARNQLSGVIKKVNHLGVNDLIEISLISGSQLVASVTHASTKELALIEGKTVLLLIKAPAVIVQSEKPLKTKDNQLSGKLVSMSCEEDKTELKLVIDNQQIIYAVTDSQASVNYQLDQDYWISFAANQIIIASLNE